jgi:L-amino acid N-acyltransferase YncA
MRIRSAQVTDAGGIARVHVDCWRSTYAGLVPQAHLDGLSRAQREKDWCAWLTPGSAPLVVVAEDDEGQIVGFASAGRYRGRNRDFKAELYAIYLLNTHQRQGWGTRLLCEIVHRLIQEQMPSLVAWVLAENSSRGFYERLGGKQIAQKEVVIGGVKLPAFAYGWPDVGIILQLNRR